MTDEKPAETIKAYRYDGSIDLNFLGEFFSVAQAQPPDTGIIIRDINTVPNPAWNVRQGDIMVRAGLREFYVIQPEVETA
jgi:hypothetical protein